MPRVGLIGNLLARARPAHAAGVLALCALAAAGGRITPRPGIDFRVLRAAPAERASRIEVIEFFTFSSPRVARFEGALENWLASRPADVVFRRMPALPEGNEEWEAEARVFLALQGMGGNVAATMTPKLLAPAQPGRFRVFLGDQDYLRRFMKANGVNAEAFANVYNSFGMQAMLAHAQQKTAAYGIASVPTFIVAGRYAVAPSEHDDPARTFAIIDDLIARARTGTPD